jgi:MFS family permease
VVAGAAFSLLFLTYGVQYSFGLFFAALTDEFGWSRGSLAGVFSLYAGTYTALGALSGRLTDAWGPRPVVVLGGALLGGGLALASGAHSLPALYLAYFVAGCGMSTAYVPCTSTVVRWFSARRGLAVGLAMSGAGVGTFVCPAVVAILIALIGWRQAYLVVGSALGAGIAALAMLLARAPAARGLLPYGEATSAGPPGRADEPAATPVSAIVRQPAFLALALVYAATWLPVFLPMVHLVPLAHDLALPAWAAAAGPSFLGAGSLAGRLVMGVASDTIGRRAALAIALFLQSLAFVALALVGEVVGLLSVAVLYGFGYGAVTALMPAIVGDLFGPAAAGSVVGLVFAIAGPTGAVGPWAGGVIHDLTGSYVPAFLGAAALNALGLLLVVFLRPPG